MAGASVGTYGSSCFFNLVGRHAREVIRVRGGSTTMGFYSTAKVKLLHLDISKLGFVWLRLPYVGFFSGFVVLEFDFF